MCELNLYRDHDPGSVSVSNLFIDNYLAEANDAQIKIYLYLLRMTSGGHTTNISDMADKFNHTEKDVCRALRYWEKKQLLSLDYDQNGSIVGIRLHEPTVSKPRTSQISAISAPVTVKEALAPHSDSLVDSIVAVPLKKPSYSLDELKAFKNRSETPQLIYIAETYFKKQLSANDIRSILFYTDELHFSFELIDFLLEYCAGRGKTTFAYTDKVAIDWAENGITTLKEAKLYTAQFGSADKSGEAAQPRNTASAKKSSNTQFHQFKQNSYDFDELEAKLLKQQQGVSNVIIQCSV